MRLTKATKGTFVTIIPIFRALIQESLRVFKNTSNTVDVVASSNKRINLVKVNPSIAGL